MSKKSHSPPRIIRRGNHFIFLPALGWVLIDGPWYHLLSRLGHGLYVVRLPKPWPDEKDLACILNAKNPPQPPPEARTDYVEWEQVRWHPGTIISETRAKQVLLNRGFTWHHVRYLVQQWRGLLNRRTQTGWRILPSGQLPAYLGRVELAPDEWWHQTFIEQEERGLTPR